MDIEGAVTIVTGSSSGIAAACVRLLAQKGCNVEVNYSRPVEPTNVVARQCRGLGVEALVVQVDVSKDEDCRRLASSALDKWGRIDALTDNAGTTKFVAHHEFESLSADDLHAMNVVDP
ncbi:MAG: 3-oxoacyl-[acyl-carrier protein] reductase [Gammaproteobacteria bacterium]|jgi:3-oxoacyl-[acyl-carrier protein] reductase